MKEQILLFGINDANLKQQIKQALIPLRIRLKMIAEDQYHLTLGELTAADAGGSPANTSSEEAGSPANTSSEAADHTVDALPSPMLVFAGITSSRLDQILQALRAKRIIIPHKAVLTAYNAAWTPGQLYEALEEERVRFAENSKRSAATRS